MNIQNQGKPGNPAILFLHAFPFGSDMWRDQLNLYSEKFYCMAPDLPGFGKSPLPGHAMTFEHYVDSVLSHLKESKIEKAIFCGLSMGGYVALRLFERAPEICRALILCDTRAVADGNEGKLKRWGAVNLLMKNREEFVEAQWQALIGKSSKGNVSLRKRFAEIIAKNGDAGIAAGSVAMATRTDSIPVLPKIQVPTLVVVGEEDLLTPIADAETMARGIAQSRLEILPKTGHMSNLESPEAFNKVLSDFLRPLAAV